MRSIRRPGQAQISEVIQPDLGPKRADALRGAPEGVKGARFQVGFAPLKGNVRVSRYLHTSSYGNSIVLNRTRGALQGIAFLQGSF